MSSRRIKYVNREINGSSTTKIIVRDEKGDLIECNTKTTIESGLLKENEEQFSQSNNTPFLKLPLVDMVGVVGNTEVAQFILDGKFDYIHLVSDTMKDIIQELKQKTPTTPRETTSRLFFRENYRKGWKRAKERTVQNLLNMYVSRKPDFPKSTSHVRK